MRPAALTYASREALADAYDITEVARASRQIDRCLRSATDSVESLTHRVFYPEHRTMTFDYPDWFAPYRTPWILRLDDNEVTSVDSLTSGDGAITDFLLRPDDGPPFTRIETDLAESGRFTSGDTHQRSISVEGVFGYREQWDTAADLAATVNSATTEIDLSNGSEIGVGDLIRIDDEWMSVRETAFIDSTADLADDVSENDTALTVDDGTQLNVGELVSVDAERMRVTAITGDTATVLRAWDGTQLAAHTSATSVFAKRQAIVTRGVLGTDAASHLEDAAVDRFVYPSLIVDLCLAEAMSQLVVERAGLARDAGVNTDALESLRERAYRTYGRKARTRAV